MRYYTRQTESSSVAGPYSAEELVARLDAGLVGPNSLVSSALPGDRLTQLRQGRACDWFPLTQIPALAARFPPPEPEPAKKRPITRIDLIVTALVAVNATVVAAKQPSCLTWSAAAALAGGGLWWWLWRQYVAQRISLGSSQRQDAP